MPFKNSTYEKSNVPQAFATEKKGGFSNIYDNLKYTDLKFTRDKMPKQLSGIISQNNVEGGTCISMGNKSNQIGNENAGFYGDRFIPCRMNDSKYELQY